ncbi:MAG TPA: TlpA disulfide reductase family protein [Gemmatimonas sp.]|uniref:TlpA family protein disulfide reductase n=1 Tax=Gemmatimonas sp. TaxID=1962908 RepID=UPI002EDB1347
MTDGPPLAELRRRWPRWASWSNLVFAAVMVWAAPRCWPHVEALAGAKAREHRQPSFTVTTRTGRVLSADSLRGRVVLVNIWATWCAPCRAEMPLLQQLADAYAADSVIVLGLSVDRGPSRDVDAFLADRGITYPVAIVSDDVVRAFGGVRGYPTSLVLDRDGVVRHAVMGPVGPITLRPALRRLLAEPRHGTTDSLPRAVTPLPSH